MAYKTGALQQAMKAEHMQGQIGRPIAAMEPGEVDYAPKSEVREALDRLQFEITNLRVRFEQLGNSLESVLAPASPAVCPNNCSAPNVSCGLAIALDNLGGELAQLVEQMTDVARRLRL